jgi:hypothetical protein
MLNISPAAQVILDHLVRLLPSVVPGKPQTYLTYKQLHEQLGLPGIPHELEHQGLGGLATAIESADLPGITGLIIRQDTMMPGGGYFKLYRRELDAFIWWENEIRRAVDFDWSPYSKAILSKGYPKTPVAHDGKKPNRVETTTYRILRDTPLALKIKFLHNYECQICGEAIMLVDGRRYAEAHHIRPLGSPHNGPDCAENIICVCPNHHVLLDYFSMPLSCEGISSVEGHDIGRAFIEFHNRNFEDKQS